MRNLLRLLLVLAASLSLASVAFADKPDRAAEKAERAAEKADRAAEKAAKAVEKAAEKAAERLERGTDHPHGGPPGLLKKPGEPANPEFTKFAERVGAAPTNGTVKVKVPGSNEFADLIAGQPLPVGSVVDATDGLVEITAEAALNGTEQNAVVTGGVFQIAQDATSGITDLKLQGGDFSACEADDDDGDGAPTARASSRRRKKGGVARGIWAAGTGRFRTSGRHSAATVRGTRWATVDRCHSTTVKVFEGVVDVKDFNTGRTIAVRAGERHVARERRG
jgi:hypothetical protein